jgi:hypothetical protein
MSRALHAVGSARDIWCFGRGIPSPLPKPPLAVARRRPGEPARRRMASASPGTHPRCRSSSGLDSIRNGSQREMPQNGGLPGFAAFPPRSTSLPWPSTSDSSLAVYERQLGQAGRRAGVILRVLRGLNSQY